MQSVSFESNSAVTGALDGGSAGGAALIASAGPGVTFRSCSFVANLATAMPRDAVANGANYQARRRARFVLSSRARPPPPVVGVALTPGGRRKTGVCVCSR